MCREKPTPGSFRTPISWGHANIIKFCQRPYADVVKMDIDLMNRWNEVVEPNDVVIHLGDFGNPTGMSLNQLLATLNGHIFLIRGNHDKSNVYKRFPFTAPWMSVRLQQHFCFATHRPIYPHPMRNKQHDPFGDHKIPELNSAQINKYSFYLTGHIHNNYERDAEENKVGRLWTGKSLNLSVELHDYRPVHEDEVLRLLKKRERSIRFDECTIIRGDAQR